MQESSGKTVTLVLGGVRSGKSRYGQRLAERAERVVFVATAEVREDAEMRAKVERHVAERPQGWRTVEEPLELGEAIRAAGATGALVLVDCLTMFAGRLLEESSDGAGPVGERRIAALCEAVEGARSSVVLISNEVGSGVVPAFALGRQYRDLLGEINQRVAAVADEVVLMVAGLPLVVKAAGGAR